MRGTVLDSSGAAVPQAKLTLRSLETGESRAGQTNGQGEFSFPLLKIGSYELKAEAGGFRSVAAPAVIRAGEAAVLRLSLTVGDVTDTVTVTDAVSLLDSENSQVQTSVAGAAIQEIPVSRDPNQFARIAPGIAPVPVNNAFLGSGSFNANGGRGRGNNVTIDGITATDVTVTGTGGTLNSLNFSSIKEVKIITNNFSAEYGRNANSQVLYISKNGSNDLHGELFEYFRNDKLNARPFFDTTGKPNIVRQNEYGYAIGGPVLIPRVLNGRNRFFWYTDFSQLKTRGAGATRIARVPTPEQAAGITDPTTRALFDQYKIPTSPTGQIETSAANLGDAWQYSVRGDINLSSRDTLWLRYSSSDLTGSSPDTAFINTNLPGFGSVNTGRPRHATAAYTHLFSPAAVNEFRFGFGQFSAGFEFDTPYPIGPRISFQDGSVNTVGQWEGLPQGREQKSYQFSDNLSFLVGRHSLKVGGEMYYLEVDSRLDALSRPVLAFANFAGFQTGTPASFQQRFGDSFRANRVKNVFSYIQDDWKISRTLTLNLGLRLEWAGGPTEADGRISNLNLNNQASYGAAGAGPFGLIEVGQPSFHSNYNWGPRVGFAWAPGSGKTVIRGGYGIAYDFIFMGPIANQRFLPPFIVQGTLSGQQNFTGTNSLANIIAGTSTIQTSTAATAGQLSMTARNFGAVSPGIDQSLRNPQVHQWSFGLQREALGIVWKASYLGTKGNYLPRARDLNLMATPPAPATSVADETTRLSQFAAALGSLNGNVAAVSNRIDPRYNAILWIDSSANSNYHSLQLEAQKRLGSTLLLSANYTFAKSIDDGSDVLGVLINDSSNQQNPRNNRDNRGPSQFDLQHRVAILHEWQPGWFKGSSHWATRNILGNWTFSGITTFRSGFPVNLDAGSRLGITPLTVIGGGSAVRPNATGPVDFNPQPAGSAGAPFGLSADAAGQPISSYAQSLGLSQPLLGNFGTLGRNVFRLNGERNFDWTVAKNFTVAEHTRIQVRAEFYNIFNNTSFQEIQRTITAPDFGQYNVVGQDARRIQLAARFVF